MIATRNKKVFKRFFFKIKNKLINKVNALKEKKKLLLRRYSLFFYIKKIFSHANSIKNNIILYNFLKKKNIRKSKHIHLNNYLSMKRKKIQLEYVLNILLPFRSEIKLNNFINSKTTPSLFRKNYKELYIIYKQKKLNFYNKQFKEIFSSLAVSLLLCKSSMLTLIISRALGVGRFKYFRRNLYYIFNNLFLLQRKICPFNAVKVNISGKFKGKAKRTNLRYKLSPGIFKPRSFFLSKINFHVGYVMTQTGIFGIKV
jgi:hypothetical protein